MNKLSYGVVGTFLGILCLGVSALAQETQPDKQSLPFDFKPKMELGQFTITAAQPEGHFLIEANKAPLESILQAVARLGNYKLIIADEAKVTLQNSKITSVYVQPMTSAKAFALFVRFSDNISWGQVGKDTYLVVTRTKSEVEIARDKKLLAPQPERAPDAPEQAHPTGRFYLLSPDTKQN